MFAFHLLGEHEKFVDKLKNIEQRLTILLQVAAAAHVDMLVLVLHLLEKSPPGVLLQFIGNFHTYIYSLIPFN